VAGERSKRPERDRAAENQMQRNRHAQPRQMRARERQVRRRRLDGRAVGRQFKQRRLVQAVVESGEARVFLALLPLLGHDNQSHDWAATGWSFIKGVGVLALLIFGGRYALRPLLRRVAETQIREAFSAATLLVVIGTALLVSGVGLSMALGAFVAGVLLADSEYRHELEADIEPFKGLLLGLFFMGVGMSANLSLVLTQPLMLIGGVLSLFTVKIATVWITARLAGQAPATARGMAFALPQAGEFGFVLFSLAVAGGVMGAPLAENLVLIVTLSMALSPLLMTFETRVLQPWLDRAPPRPFDLPQEEGSRVIIAGFGRFGQIVGRVLRMRKIGFTALESSPAQVDFVRRFGNRVYYGDASRLELLEAAGIAKAEILVVAMDDVEASVRTVELVLHHYPDVKVFARARNRQHALVLMEAGARYIIRETFLSSLDLSQRVLESLGLSRRDALESVTRFRASDEKTLQEQLQFKDDEQKLVQTAQLAARELEKLFEADVDKLAEEGAAAATERERETAA